MGWSLTIGRIAGTDIRLHFTFLLFLVWIGVTDYLVRGAQAAQAGNVQAMREAVAAAAVDAGRIHEASAPARPAS